MDLDTAQKETRNISSELFKVKNAYDESIVQLEEVRRENKLLSNEIKDIMDQISEGGRSIHEIDKVLSLYCAKIFYKYSVSRSASVLTLRRWSWRPPCPRPRLPWSRRRTRC